MAASVPVDDDDEHDLPEMDEEDEEERERSRKGGAQDPLPQNDSAGAKLCFGGQGESYTDCSSPFNFFFILPYVCRDYYRHSRDPPTTPDHFDVKIHCMIISCASNDNNNLNY